MTHTRQSVSDFIQARWESDLPDQVLEALKPYQGKNITTRLLDVLPGGKGQWRMSRQYGWTELETINYIRTQGNEGTRLILARSESSVPLDLAFVEKENPAYYAGRRERNHARMEARNTAALLDKLAHVLNRVETARVLLDSAKADLDALTEHGEVFNPERYALRKICGYEEKP